MHSHSCLPCCPSFSRGPQLSARPLPFTFCAGGGSSSPPARGWKCRGGGCPRPGLAGMTVQVAARQKWGALGRPF
jgi:hypothetical protein